MSDSTERQTPAPTVTASRFDRLDRWILLGLALVTLFLYCRGLGSYPLADPWEPRYALAMQEMSERGDYITPFYQGKVRWTKPILIYWSMYLPILIGGNNELTVRLPSALAAVLGVLLTYFFLRRLRGRATALMGACVLATLPQYFYMARQATPDMLLACFIAGAMGFYALARFGSDRRKLWFCLFYASVGLGFLAKGPIAAAMTLGALMLFWLIDFDPATPPSSYWSVFRETLRSHHVWLGLGIFLLINGPWYTAMLSIHGFTFIDSFFIDENLQRFTESLEGKAGIFTFYVQTFLHGMYPWTSLLPLSLLFLFDRRRGVDEETRQRWYYLSWVLAGFLMLTVTATKYDHYILPILPAVAVLVALFWESYFRSDNPFWIRLTLILAIAFNFLPIRDFLFESSANIIDNFTLEREIEGVEYALPLKIVLAGWSLTMLLGLFTRRRALVAGLAVALAFGNAVYFSQVMLPVHAYNGSIVPLVRHIEAIREPGDQLAYYGSVHRSVPYYMRPAGGPAFEVEEQQALLNFVRGKQRVFVIVADSTSPDAIRQLARSGGRWSGDLMESPRYELYVYEP